MMRWYLFWEAIWLGLGEASCWLWLECNLNWITGHGALPLFCYQQKSNITEKRWRKYPRQSEQQIIESIIMDEQRHEVQELARRGER
jgi:hypothetical protein